MRLNRRRQPAVNAYWSLFTTIRTERDLSNNALEAALVPLDNLLLGDAVGGTDLGLASSTLGNTVTWASPVIRISASVLH